MIRWACLFLVRILVILVGVPGVLVALPFTRTVGHPQPFTQYPNLGYWHLERLPDWALWWDNAYDGVLGDKRGWWANHRGGKHQSLLSKWVWTAIRNPANYFSRNIVGVDVSDLPLILLAGGQEVVEETPGKLSWQFLRALRTDGALFFRLYGVYRYKSHPTHCFTFDFGWKIKLSHRGTPKDARPQDRFKGVVFTVSPWKEL